MREYGRGLVLHLALIKIGIDSYRFIVVRFENLIKSASAIDLDCIRTLASNQNGHTPAFALYEFKIISTVFYFFILVVKMFFFKKMDCKL